MKTLNEQIRELQKEVGVWNRQIDDLLIEYKGKKIDLIDYNEKYDKLYNKKVAVLDEILILMQEQQNNKNKEIEAKDKQIEIWWKDMDNAKFGEDYEVQEYYLTEDWLHFKEGTWHETIMEWFKDEYSKGIHELIALTNEQN